MDNKLSPKQLKALYEQGENISQKLRDDLGIGHNTEQIIELSYDLQAGSYIDLQSDDRILSNAKKYTSRLVEIITQLNASPESILEAGIGEGTTLSRVLNGLNYDKAAYGFDLSWSRVAYASRWLKQNNLNNVELCTGDMFHLPIADNAIDIVYTSHAIEPNGGRETEIIKELYRVTRGYLILLEPGYELASPEAKARMETHGFCKNLAGIAEQNGYKVLTHELFPYAVNPLNPTALTVIEKRTAEPKPDHIFACPTYKTKLSRYEGVMYSDEALVAYPVLADIPCLRPENGIIASKYEEFAT